jgi:hypothetical protein
MFDESLLPFIARLSPTIMWIALTVGLLLFVIGYFAGGKLHISRIGMSVFLATIIGVLALPAPIQLYTIAKAQMEVKTIHVKNPEKASSESTKDKQSPNQTRAQTVSPETNQDKPDFDEEIPVGLQVLTFIMYVAWTAFLIAMGIFLYETLIVTAKEAEMR